VQEVGNLTQYALNRSHVAFPAVELLADLRNEVVRRLSRTIRDWQIEASHASLFGSAARGDVGTSSDIDLLIIRPAGLSEDDVRWREQLDALARAVLDWTGNRAAIAELSTRELTHVQSSTTGEIRRDAITLAGRDIGELLEAVR
jgi:predicted nucleotidyltransferase